MRSDVLNYVRVADDLVEAPALVDARLPFILGLAVHLARNERW